MKYTISILTHSALALSHRCIASVIDAGLKDGTLGETELILTANGNPAAPAEFRRASHGLNFALAAFRIVENECNRGFIEPNNEAFAKARGEYFVMLNDDATVPSGWLAKLEQPFIDDPKCAISGAKGSARTLSMGFVGFHGSELDYIEGSCMMVKRSIFACAPLFSAYLDFAYCEDSDLCLRARKAGHTIHEADFRLERHAGGATSATVPGIHMIKMRNFETCRRIWASYLNRRTFV